MVHIKKALIIVVLILIFDLFLLGLTLAKITGSADDVFNFNSSDSSAAAFGDIPVSDGTMEADTPDACEREIKLPDSFEILDNEPQENVTNTETPGPKTTTAPAAVKKVTSAETALPNPDFTPMGTLILVNKNTPLSMYYRPDNLIAVNSRNAGFEIFTKDGGMMIHKKAFSPLCNMLKEASKDSLENIILSSIYRSYSLQNRYHSDKLRAYMATMSRSEATRKASMVIAPPGKSEHQTGLAVDLTTPELLKKEDKLVQLFGETPQGKWIYKNSWKFGFVVRYMPDKTNITGIISEPWHIRYVGLPHSEIMYKSNLSLEEYITYLRKQGKLKFKAYNGTNYEISLIAKPNKADIEKLSKATEVSDLTMFSPNEAFVTKIVS